MADTKDYLTVYKRFFDNFAKTVDPDDQLPVRVAGYRLWDNEVVGETVDWTLQYLSQRNCPPSLLAPITRIVIDEIKQACETQPVALGFKTNENCYLPLKLMQAVTNKVNEVCLRFCDNGRVTSLPPPSPGPLISSCAIKNSRRCMEDRHVILEDFHAFFNIKDTSPASYYGVFDGHAGTDAAIYSVSHLHQFLAESSYYPTDPEKAIKDAFFRTDSLFIEKSNKENLHSGTTAVCALLRQKEKKLYVAWLGDSQAVIVRNGQITKLVNPHKPDREDEMTRIQDMGGSVVFWGTWRVNGQLAVSRAIGDLLYKPYVTAEPDVSTVDLHGDEDFLILACDGLWDFVSAEDVVRAVYNQVQQNPGDLEAVSQKLVQLSKQLGSTDNITVIVTFLTEPSQLAARSREKTPSVQLRSWAALNGPLQQHQQHQQPSAPAMEAFDINTNTPASVPAPSEHTNPFDTNSTGGNPFEADLSPPAVCAQKAAAAAAASGLLLDLDSLKEDPFKDPFQAPPFNNGHANGNGNLFDFLQRPANGKAAPANAGSAAEDDDDDDDDDSGAENAGSGGGAADAAPLGKNPFGADIELQRQQLSEFDRENEPRRDTPTPPADEVPGVIGLVSDNVAESGEESEDEWNYYKVDPSEKEPQTKQEVCEEPALKVEESDENMESQLNPNAAEFIPSPTHSKQSLEEILSQTQGSESDSLSDKNSSSNATDLAATQEKEFDKKQNELSSSQKEDLVNPPSVESCLNEESFDKGTTGGLDESTAFSTQAVFGDESSVGTDFQKILDTSSNIMETSLMEQDLNASEETGPETILGNSVEPEIVEQETVFQQDILNDFQKEPVHISFELQKEIAPHMESQPERVKVGSEDQSPVQELEQSFQASGYFSENKNVSEDLEFVHNETSNQPSVFEDFVSGSKAGLEDAEASEIAKMVEDVTANIEDAMNVNEHVESDVQVNQRGSDQLFSVDNLVELPKPSDFSKDFEVSSRDLNVFAGSPPSFIQNQVSQLENNVEVPSQLSESPLSELMGELSVQQESQNHLSNEISTPEYEKFEKDLEASEKYQDKIFTTDAEISSEFTQFSKSDADFSADVLLESAHPDREELLSDACTETPADVTSTEIPLKDDFAAFETLKTNISSPGPEFLEPASSEFVCSDAELKLATPDAFTQSDIGLLNESALENIVSSLIEPAPLDSEALPRTHSDVQVMETVSAETIEEQMTQSNVTEELENVRSVLDSCANIPSHKVENSDIAPKMLESTEVPPPTPLITQLVEGELLDFSCGSSNLSEAVEKLSVTEQTSKVSDVEEVQEITSEIPAVVPLENSQQVVENLISPAVDLEAIVPAAEVVEPKISEVGAHEPSNDSTLAQETTNDIKLEEAESVKNNVSAGAVAAGVVAAAATVATAAAVVTPSVKEVKKEKEVSAKKSTLSAKDKRLSSEKPQTATKSPITSRLTATTLKSKSPTSPVKSPAATKTAPTRPASSTVPNKPLSKAPTKAATKPLTSAPTRTVTSTVASRPKPSPTSARPLPTTVNLSKTRPISAPAEKKPLTNGEIKTAAKRPESSKTQTTRVSSGLSQSSTMKTATRTVSATSTVARTKAPLNGPSKPRPLSSVAQVRTVTKTSNEKDIKETANKQISTRTTTSTVRSTTTTTASKTSVTSASRKTESKVLTNGKGPAMKPSSMTKTTTTTTSRIVAKKPATTTPLKSPKTDSIVEKSETVQGSPTVIKMQ